MPYSESQASCSECCSQSYSEEDFKSYEEFYWWGDCPSTSEPCPSADPKPSCAGATVTGELISRHFPNSVKDWKTPKADVYASFDDFGFIGSLSCNETGHGYCASCGVQGTVDPQIEEFENTFVLKVPFQATNAYWGGPYGISCSARFYFV